jgi:hypothetical protein
MLTFLTNDFEKFQQTKCRDPNGREQHEDGVGNDCVCGCYFVVHAWFVGYVSVALLIVIVRNYECCMQTVYEK